MIAFISIAFLVCLYGVYFQKRYGGSLLRTLIPLEYIWGKLCDYEVVERATNILQNVGRLRTRLDYKMLFFGLWWVFILIGLIPTYHNERCYNLSSTANERLKSCTKALDNKIYPLRPKLQKKGMNQREAFHFRIAMTHSELGNHGEAIKHFGSALTLPAMSTDFPLSLIEAITYYPDNLQYTDQSIVAIMSVIDTLRGAGASKEFVGVISRIK